MARSDMELSELVVQRSDVHVCEQLVRNFADRRKPSTQMCKNAIEISEN